MVHLHPSCFLRFTLLCIEKTDHDRMTGLLHNLYLLSILFGMQ